MVSRSLRSMDAAAVGPPPASSAARTSCRRAHVQAAAVAMLTGCRSPDSRLWKVGSRMTEWKSWSATGRMRVTPRSRKALTADAIPASIPRSSSAQALASAAGLVTAHPGPGTGSGWPPPLPAAWARAGARERAWAASSAQGCAL